MSEPIGVDTHVDAPGLVEAPRQPGWPVWILAGAVVLPILVATISALTAHPRWWPVSDLALEYLRSIDVGTIHTPLVGPYSRYFFYHPGPLTYYVFAPFTHTIGPVGMLVATGLLNAASIVGAILIGRRRHGLWGATAVALVALVLLHAVTPAAAINPWNPWVPVFPFLFAVICSWAICEGDGKLLPWLVASASFTVQTHIGYAPLVVFLVMAPLVALVIRRRRATYATIRRFRSSIGISILVGLILWSPPLYEQIRGNPGNFVAIWRSLVETHGMDLGAARWLHVLASQVAPLGPWSTGGPQVAGTALASSDPSLFWAFATPAAALALGAGASRRRGWLPFQFAVFSVGLGCIAYWAMTNIRDLPAPYLFHWVYVVAAMIWLSILVSTVMILADLFPSLRRSAPTWLAIAMGAATLAGLSAIPSAAGVQLPDRAHGAEVQALAARVEPLLDHSQRYEVRWHDSRVMEGRVSGFIAALDDRGFTALAPWSRVAVLQFGKHRVVQGPDDVDRILTVYGTTGSQPTRPIHPDERVILTYDPRSPELARRLQALIAERADLERRAVHMPSLFTAEGKRVVERLTTLNQIIEGTPDRYVVTLRPAH